MQRAINSLHNGHRDKREMTTNLQIYIDPQPYCTHKSTANPIGNTNSTTQTFRNMKKYRC